MASLGSLGKFHGGGTPSKSNLQFWTGGSIPWVSPKDMKTQVIHDSTDHITEAAVRESSTDLLERRSILFVTRSGILERTLPVALTVVPVAVNQDIKALTPLQPLVPSYILWGAIAFGLDILRRCSKNGTTVASIETSCLLSFQIPIAPVSEQHRIVEAIETYTTRIDDAISTLEKVQRNLKRYRASVLKAAVEGKLVPTEAELARAEGRDYEPASVLLQRILAERRRRWEDAELAKMKAKGKVPKDDKWKAKYVEPVGPETSGLLELPEGWCWVGPEEVASHEEYSIGIGPFGSNLKVSDYREDGVPLVFVRNIRTKSFGHEGSNFITPAKAIELKAHIVKAGDLLITKMGEPPGDAAIYPSGSPDGIITADCIRLRIPPRWACPRYALSAIKSPLFRDQIIRIASGVAQKKISLERFKRLGLPFPPLKEQLRIAKEIDRLLSVSDIAENVVERELIRINRLRQSILKWAFEGRLVDQDPNDEPASVLLERIRAERAAKPAKPARRPRTTTRKAPNP